MKQLINKETVASMLHLKPDTIRKMCAAKELPHYKLGHVLRFDPDEIEGWLKKRKVDTKPVGFQRGARR